MTATLSLLTNSSKITELCKSLECSLAAIPDLAGMSLSVDVLNNFDNLPEAKITPTIKDTCAVYRRSTNTIYVNDNTFFLLSPDVQKAVFAHEIAHALSHRDSLMDSQPKYSEFGEFGEEFLADRLACEWGFFKGLSIERNSSYGQRYVKALEHWQDEIKYLKEMDLWHNLKIAGIV